MVADLLRRPPTSCARPAGMRCVMLTDPPEYGMRVGELDQRHARRERTVHVDPITGDDRERRRALEHRRLLGACRAIGRRSAPPAGPASRAVFRISKMLKTFSPPSPSSNTNRDCSPSTTMPVWAGPVGQLAGPLRARCRRFGIGRDEHRRGRRRSSGSANSCDSRRSPSTVVTALTRRTRLQPAELGAPRVVGLRRCRHLADQLDGMRR